MSNLKPFFFPLLAAGIFAGLVATATCRLWLQRGAMKRSLKREEALDGSGPR